MLGRFLYICGLGTLYKIKKNNVNKSKKLKKLKKNLFHTFFYHSIHSTWLDIDCLTCFSNKEARKILSEQHDLTYILRLTGEKLSEMSSYQFLDDLIREYLLFRGFVSTLKVFDNDIKCEKEKGLRSDK